MNIPFFYEDFSNQLQIVLSENNVHYIANVLRMKTNEKIVVVNGKGIKCLCKLLYVSKTNSPFVSIEVDMFFCFEIISYNILKFISYPKSDSTFRNNLDFKNSIKRIM